MYKTLDVKMGELFDYMVARDKIWQGALIETADALHENVADDGSLSASAVKEIAVILKRAADGILSLQAEALEKGTL